MKLWRLARADRLAPTGQGAAEHGARWTSPGKPVAHFASEPGLAVLIVLRYHLGNNPDASQDYRLGWTHWDGPMDRLPYVEDAQQKRALGDDWLRSGRSLFAAVTSAVLPESDIILMNPLHAEASGLPAITSRPFSFADCLALPGYDAPTKPLP